MAIKNTLLGGSDWESPARVKPSDLNDTFDAAANYINLAGIQFKNFAQMLFNSAYIGFNSKLNVATGVPNLKNIKYDVFNTDTATTKTQFSYDGTNKLYTASSTDATLIFKPVDMSKITYFVVISATSYNSISNNVKRIDTGKWLVYDSTFNASTEVQRAKVWETLLSDGQISKFTTVTAIKVSDSNDVGFRGFKETLTGAASAETRTHTLTFTNTSTNYVSAWSNLSVNTGAGGSGTNTLTFVMPSGSTLNTATCGPTSGASSTEIGTDTSAEEKTNPASAIITVTTSALINSPGANATVILLCKSAITETSSGSPTTTLIDYKTTYSLPDTTLASALTTENNPSISEIFPEITDCIATWNSYVAGANTLSTSISADGTNYEEVTDATIHRFTNTGTNLYIKFEIDRVDTTAVDKISEYAILYNTGA